MSKVIIALNKVDQFKEETRPADIEGATKKLKTRFAHTKFGGDIPIVPVSAVTPIEGYGPNDLIKYVLDNLDVPDREGDESKFLYMIDHCFTIKGQGTIITGTVLRGKVQVGQTIEFPALKIEKKIKSM